MTGTPAPRASPSPEVDSREQLADAIVQRSHDIERRWLEQVKKSLKRDDVSQTELRDSMPEYVLRLADGLRQPGTVEAGGSSSWVNVARAHAASRVRLGFDIDQLVDDFVVLRRVLSRVMDEEGLLLDAPQSSRIADMIEGAIAAALANANREVPHRRESDPSRPSLRSPP